DVGRLEGGGVVHPVPGHGHDVATLLKHPDEADLVLRGDARDHPDARELLDQLLVAHGSELRARDGTAFDPELRSDRTGRRGMVAGDHADADAGALALRDGVPRLPPGVT